MDFNNFYISRNGNDSPPQRHCQVHDIASAACVARLRAVADDAFDQWQTRLRACVRANGVHFEHTL